MSKRAEKDLAAMGFCTGMPVRYAVWVHLDQSFAGTFDDLVLRIGSKRERVLGHLLALWEAGHVSNLPPGTPTGAVDGTATDAFLIEGTCVEVQNV